jgi:hypothetical protein
MGVRRVDLLCLMWCLWQERNARSFEDVETLVTELQKIVINTLYTWKSAYHSFLVSTFVYFLNLCSYSLD